MSDVPRIDPTGDVRRVLDLVLEKLQPLTGEARVRVLACAAVYFEIDVEQLRARFAPGRSGPD